MVSACKVGLCLRGGPAIQIGHVALACADALVQKRLRPIKFTRVQQHGRIKQAAVLTLAGDVRARQQRFDDGQGFVIAAQGVQHISQISRCQGTCLANGNVVGEFVVTDAVTQRIVQTEQISFQSAEQRLRVRLCGDHVILVGGNVDKPNAS